MRRIVVGFLVLFCIALSGIFLIETGVHSADAGTLPSNASRVELRLGGEPAPTGDGLSNHAGSGVTVSLKPTAPPTWQPPEPTLRHVVKQGDNLSKIALAYLGSRKPEAVARIQKANKLKSPKDLKIGVTLQIPVAKFERFVSDGLRTVGAVAERYYGDPATTAPLFHANPTLPREKDSKIPMGFTVFVPK
jgi:LysM repeat protein